MNLNARNVLLALLAVIVLLAIFGRNTVPIHYSGSAGGLLLLVLIVGLFAGWF
jgi:hypothetical protein